MITLFSQIRLLLLQSTLLLHAAQQTVVVYLKRKCQYIAVGQRSQVQPGLTSSKPHVGELFNRALKLYGALIKLCFFQQTKTITFTTVTSVHDSDMICSMIKLWSNQRWKCKWSVSDWSPRNSVTHIQHHWSAAVTVSEALLQSD